MDKQYVVWALREKNEWLYYTKIGSDDDLEKAVEIGKNCNTMCWGIRFSISPEPRYLSDDNYWIEWAKPEVG